MFTTTTTSTSSTSATSSSSSSSSSSAQQKLDILRIFSYLDLNRILPMTNGSSSTTSTSSTSTATSSKATFHPPELVQIRSAAETLKNSQVMIWDAESLIKAMIQLYNIKKEGGKKLPYANGVENVLHSREAELAEAGLKLEKNADGIEIDFSDSFFDYLFTQLKVLLAKEKNKAAISELDDVYDASKKLDDAERLALLKQVLEKHIVKINIAEIMRDAKRNTSSASIIDDEDVIVLVARTGTGKSTTAHLLAGSKFKADKKTHKVYANHWPEAVEDFIIGSSVTSQTSHFAALDLSDTKRLFVDYKLKKKLFLCDTPGIGDTGGINKKVANAIIISNPLKKAKSVRLWVEFSTRTGFGDRATTLLQDLEAIAKFLPNTAKHTHAIYYAFTGQGDMKFQETIMSQLEDIIANQDKLGYSNDVLALLQGMQAQFTKNIKKNKKIPFIDVDNPKQTRENIMRDLLELTPITDPVDSFIPYIEQSDRGALAHKLSILFEEFTLAYQSLNKLLATDGQEQKCMEELMIANEKLEQIAFVHDNFAGYDPTDYLAQSKKMMLDFAANLVAQSNEIMDASANKLLTDKDFAKIYAIQTIQANLRTTWRQIHNDAFAKLMKLPDKEVQPAIDAVTPDVLKDNLGQLITDYRATLRHKLRLYNDFQKVKFRHNVVEKLRHVVHILENPAESAISGFPLLKIELADECTAQRAARTLAYAGSRVDLPLMDALNAQLVNDASQLENMRGQLGKVEKHADIDIILQNLARMNKEFRSNDDQLNKDYVSSQIKDLKDLFGSALECFDFQEAVCLLDVIDKLYDASPTNDADDEVDALKTRFLVALNTIVPAFLIADAFDPNRKLTKEEAKKYIYVTQLMVALSGESAVLTHFKSYSTTGGKPISLSGIYEKLTSGLTESHTAAATEIDRILANPKAMQGIVDLGPVLQQMWYLLSIPTRKQKERVAAFLIQQAKVKEFAIAFRHQVIANLNATPLLITLYDDIVTYLNNLRGQSWVQELKLHSETSAIVIEAVVERTNKLITIMDALDLQYANHQQLLDNLPVLEELLKIRDVLHDYLPADTKVAIHAALKRYENKVVATLNGIKNISAQDEEFSHLKLSQMTDIASYCEITISKDVLPSIELASSAATSSSALVEPSHSSYLRQLRVETSSAFNVAFVNLTAAKSREAEGHLQTLTSWQSAGSTMTASDEEIIKFVEGLRVIFAAMETLREALPKHYKNCNDPIATLAVSLETYLTAFAKSLSGALTERLTNAEASDEAMIRLDRMMYLCKTLEVLDPYLPASDDAKRPTFARLHERYNSLLTGAFLKAFKEILSLVRLGEYEAAVDKTDDLMIEDEVKATLCIQTSAIIVGRAGRIDKQLAKLQQSHSTKPEILADLMENLTRLDNAQELIPSELLDETAQKKRTATLNDAQAAINQWFANCQQKLVTLIAEFKVHEFNAEMLALKTTLESMHTKPTNYDTALTTLNNSFKDKIRETKAAYSQPIAEWRNNKFRMAHVHQQLAGVTFPQVEGEDKEEWSDVPVAVMNAVNTACERLEVEIDANTKSVAEVVSTIRYVEEQFAGMPQTDGSLMHAAMKRCQTSLKRQTDKILNGSLAPEEQFSKTCELMAEKSKLKYASIGFDFTVVLKPVHEQSHDLREHILAAFNANTFPKDMLKKFIAMYDSAKKYSEVVRSDYDAIGKGFRDLTAKISGNISAGVTLLATNPEAALKNIFASCVLLREMNECIDEIEEDNADSLLVLFPKNFNDMVSEHIKKFLTILKKNREIFGTALHDKKARELKTSYDLAAAWVDAMSEVARYIDLEAKPDKTMRSLIEFNKENSPLALANAIEAALAALVAQVHMDISKYLNNTPEKGDRAREDYFNRLMANLSFISDCRVFEREFDAKKYATQVLAATQFYLKGLFETASSELEGNVETRNNWDKFNDCYNELMLFTRFCSGNPQLAAIEIPLKPGDPETAPSMSSASGVMSFVSTLVGMPVKNTIRAIDAAKVLENRFKTQLDNEFETQKENNRLIKKGVDSATVVGIRSRQIAFALGLQRIINTAPRMSGYVRKLLNDFLLDIRGTCGVPYLQSISNELQAEETGLGLSIIGEQACFKGLSIAVRNTKTLTRTIDYVIEEMRVKKGMGEERKLSDRSAAALKQVYENVFEKTYNELLTKYLKPELDFQKDPDIHLAALKKELMRNVKAVPSIKIDDKGKIVWDKRTKDVIPLLVAYLFAIWTLRDSKSYFELGTNDRNQLKQPHAGQVAAVIRMLQVTSQLETLNSNLVELLSGQGKSILFAVTAEVLALIGFDVSVACYSDYLSKRDDIDFRNMFEFLGISQYIKYGTIDSLEEGQLNQNGDLRSLTEKLVTGASLVSVASSSTSSTSAATSSTSTSSTATSPVATSRPRICIIDEADVVLDRKKFYSKYYNPIARLNTDWVRNLYDAIWRDYKSGITLKLETIQGWPVYKACVGAMPDASFIIDKNVVDFLKAIKKFAAEKKHDYIVKDGLIAYPYQDGTSTEIFLGHDTICAYYHEHDAGNITRKTLNDNIGLLINCGQYSYADMFKEKGNFSCVLGATGTLRALSKPEQEIVTKKFGIEDETFTPSAYGPNKLSFHKSADVKVEKRSNYFHVLATTIQEKQKGTRTGTPIRPVLVFFKDQASLMKFHDSPELKALGGKVAVMTKDSSSNPEQHNAEIVRAVMPAQITLIEADVARGRDTICLNRAINDNGGLQGIQAYLAEQVSEEEQNKCRAGRQGEEGGFSCVYCEEDLIEDYGITSAQIQQMRARDNLYDGLNEVRVNKFVKTYEGLDKKMDEAREVLHKPSMELWEQLHNIHSDDDRKNAIRLLRALNKVPVTKARGSKTLVLIDATGSMSGTIDGVKACVTDVMTNFDKALNENGLDKGSVSVQLAVYRNYLDGVDKLFSHSKWSSDPSDLLGWISGIHADGGCNSDGHEAVEVGLCHALREDGVTQVVIMGDVPPNLPHTIASKVAQNDLEHIHSSQFYHPFQSADTYIQRLAEKKIPVHCFYVAHYAESSFRKMANDTKGTSGFLNVRDRETASKSLFTLFGNTVMTDVAGDDADLRARLLASYCDRSFVKR